MICHGICHENHGYVMVTYVMVICHGGFFFTDVSAHILYKYNKSLLYIGKEKFTMTYHHDICHHDISVILMTYVMTYHMS